MSDWSTTSRLGELFKTASGGTPSTRRRDYYEGGAIPWLNSGEVRQGSIRKAKNYITQLGLENSNARVFPKQTVLVALYGATAGQVGILETEAATNQAILGIYPNSKFAPRFVFYLLLSKYDSLIAQAVGNAQPNLSAIKIRNVPVPTVPLPEQRRIVAILDEAFAAIATAQANTEKNLANARALFKSHLQNVFAHAGEGWAENTIDSICTIGDGNHSSNYPTKGDLVPSGIPFIRATNLASGRISDEDMRFLTAEKHAELKKGHLRTGDVLVTNRGEIGKTAIVDEAHDNSNLNSQIAWLRCTNKIENRFLFHALSSPQIQSHFQSAKNGAALQQFTIRQLKELRVPMPSRADQKLIANQLDALAAETDTLASISQRKLAALDELKKSLLHQAFTGQL